jgi:UDP-2-acetamido-3-amino-2,3-dideoxy-glucuronate N-acetyltransferase
MTPFVHPSGICEAAQIGQGTRVWAFAHVLPGARIGCDCNICDHVFIENDVVLGDRVTIKSGVQLWDGILVEDDVFIGPNASFANDKFPRSKTYQGQMPRTTIGRGASLGANCTILPGLHIGRYAMIGAGSVVTGNVPPFAMVLGNPARIMGYVNSTSRVEPVLPSEAPAESPPVTNLPVPGVTVHRLYNVSDLRGTVSVAEFRRDIPFTPQRHYVVSAVPSKAVRGERAHRRCKQFIVCVCGSMSLMVDDSKRRTEIVLDKPYIGVYVPPMVWAAQYRHSPDAVVLVLASDAYDPEDYIRDYEEFTQLAMGCSSG